MLSGKEESGWSINFSIVEKDTCAQQMDSVRYNWENICDLLGPSHTLIAYDTLRYIFVMSCGSRVSALI